MSDYESAVREASHKYWRKKQDELFERNAIYRQKIMGVIICILVIIFQAASDSIWWFMESVCFMVPGLYLVINDRRLE